MQLLAADPTLVTWESVRLAVGAVRFGPEGWDEPWNESFNAKNEYVPALPGRTVNAYSYSSPGATGWNGLPSAMKGSSPRNGVLFVLSTLFD